MDIVFMGTPEFSVPSLKALIDNFNVKAVVTQPDRPKGRGKRISISPVKEVALKNNIEVLQPVKIKKDIAVIERLKQINPDFIIVVAFGQILSKEILNIPKYACINVHASLLPKYRGASPINFAIINGEKETGITTMLMDEGLDTGDMLLKDKVHISDSMTAGELHDILKEKGAKLLIKTLKNFNNIKPEKQDDSLKTYAPMIKKELGKINWNKSAREINNLIRGLNPWPIAYTEYDKTKIKIYESTVLKGTKKCVPGQIINVSNEGLEVGCKEDSLLIKKIQFPNKKVMDVKQFLLGNSIDKNVVLK